MLAAVAWRAGRTRLRREAAGMSAVALGVGLLVLTQARIGPEVEAGIVIDNPVPADDASVARGEAIYTANCLVCHGPGGQGNGPGAAGLQPPPADFTIPHSRAHLDADFFYWIENGIFGSAMPAFGEELGEDEIWDVINYIRVAFQSGTPPVVPFGDAATAMPVGAAPIDAGPRAPVSRAGLTATLDVATQEVGPNALTVVVTDAAGLPVSGAAVRVFAQPMDVPNPVPARELTASEAGVYRAGDYAFGVVSRWQIEVLVATAGGEPVRFLFAVPIVAPAGGP
jgi:mono/diheme cytochrome c family protein